MKVLEPKNPIYKWNEEEELEELKRREDNGEFVRFEGHILFNPVIELLNKHIAEDGTVLLEFGEQIRLLDAYNRVKDTCSLCVQDLFTFNYKYEFKDRTDLPHRKMFWIYWHQADNGLLPKSWGEMKIYRLCDHPLCVAESHLSITKPYKSIARGEKHGRSKLTSEKVAEIRRTRQESGISYAKLGKLFGISHVQAYNVCSGKQWK